MRGLLRSFCGNQAGNIAIMSAGGMILAIACAALGVDVGTIFADRRKSQSAADLAAIVAASNIGNATNAAMATVTGNNFPAAALVGVDVGTYTANGAIAPQARFVTPATGPANAARVTLQTQTPLHFAHFFTGLNYYTLNTTATAATTALASFSIGSRLASLNGGLINAMLGGMLGTTLSLSAMDYQALINARVDALGVLSALATRVNLTAATYNTVLSSNIKVPDIVAALLATQQTTNGASSATMALSSVAQAVTGLSTTIVPGAMIDAGPYTNLPVGQIPKTGVSISVFDMLSALAEVANGTHQVATSANLGLPGIANVSLTATIGERPRGSSWVTVGSQGASVHTAQTRVLLSIQLIGSGSLSVINLPIYVEIASGTATLNAVSCGYPNVSTSTVTLGVTPGIVDAWVGNVSTSDLTNFSTKPNPPAATLVNLGATSVTGRAHAGMGNTTPTNVAFTYVDISGQVKKTVSTTNFTSSLTSSLLNDLQVGVGGLQLPGLGPLVTGIIGGATGSIDQVLASVLATLGVGIGQADVWVSGVRCDGAVLVN